MFTATPLPCPLCGAPATSLPAIVAGGGVRSGIRAISCSGTCTNYLIESEVIGNIPPAISRALSRQAATKFAANENAQLEVTASLLQVLGDQ